MLDQQSRSCDGKGHTGSTLSTTSSNSTATTKVKGANVSTETSGTTIDKNDRDADDLNRSRKSIFAELFARLQKDLRRVKTDSEMAATYAKDAKNHIDKWELTPPRRRSSFLRRLSFSSRLSKKEDSKPSSAVSG